MKILIMILLAFNVIVYAYVYFSWRKDCEGISKDRLAVSLGERVRAAFLCVTLPCILGLVTRK